MLTNIDYCNLYRQQIETPTFDTSLPYWADKMGGWLPGYISSLDSNTRAIAHHTGVWKSYDTSLMLTNTHYSTLHANKLKRSIPGVWLSITKTC